MKARLFSFLFAIIATLAMKAQNENTQWYFGINAALNFLTPNPSMLNNSSMATLEGSASIADAAGNLLFYTDGVSVYNQQHVVMANGSGLLGDQSTSQSSLIIKKPGSSTLFYIFTLGASGGNLHYSIVDMSLAAGMGSVTIINTPLYLGACAEQLHGTRHANGTDYWVLIHELGSTNFRSFQLSASGVNTTAVISSTGMFYSLYGTYGCMKISPTGNKVGVNIGNVQQGSVEISDFNASTGVVSNAINLETYNFYYAYGCEFSPDGTKFYSCGHNSSYLRQWDLTVASPAAIIASSVTINYPGFFASMQLAPNGKLYVANHGAPVISVINSPNAAGAACNFVLGAQPVNTINVITNLAAQAQYGLPNMISNPCYLNFTMQNNNAVCGSGGGSASITAVTGNIGTVTYFWSNGNDTLTTPQATNMAIGSWSVILKDNSGCTTNTVFNVFQAPPITPDMSTNLNACAGNPLNLNANGAVTYTWSTGELTPGIVVSPTATTQYSVSMTDTYNCILNDLIITVNVAPIPSYTVSNISQTICPGGTVALSASGAASYTWSNGSQSPGIIVSPTVSSNYFVTVADGTVCLVSVPVASIHVSSLPSLSVTGTFSICNPQTVTLSVSGASSYTWSIGNNPTSYSISILMNATTQLSVSGSNAAGCSSSKQLTVTVGCVDLQEHHGKNQIINIYPNPGSGSVNIDLSEVYEKIEIQIIDLLGKEIMSFDYESLSSDKGIKQLDLSSLENGIYLIKVGELVRKYIKR